MVITVGEVVGITEGVTVGISEGVALGKDSNVVITTLPVPVFVPFVLTSIMLDEL